MTHPLRNLGYEVQLRDYVYWNISLSKSLGGERHLEDSDGFAMLKLIFCSIRNMSLFIGMLPIKQGPAHSTCNLIDA